MATSNEIRQRIEQIDASTSTRRVTAAQRVSELADRRKTLATELEEIDTELGEVITEHADVISVHELAEVTAPAPAGLDPAQTGSAPTRVMVPVP
jgi:hypothetical protein